MRSFKLIAPILCLALVASALGAKKEDGQPKEGEAKKEEAKPKSGDGKKESGKKKDRKKPADSGSPEERGKINLPVPVGHDAKGLKIPYYDEAGKLQMTFNIGVASRIDESRVQMSELFLETYEDDGAPGMMIQLPTSVLDVNTRILTTEKSVTIRRSDFELTSERMEFNTQTRQGKLAGNVRMLIYNLDDEITEPSPEQRTSRAQ
jgi:hypothetical protein